MKRRGCVNGESQLLISNIRNEQLGLTHCISDIRNEHSRTWSTREGVGFS
jgi:hypothetical protein